MFNSYPNLELIEYKARQVLKSTAELDVYAFPQWWGATNTGFDVTPDGMPTMGGCAMTKEYTTVVSEVSTSRSIVFFGNRLCYMVENPTVDFNNDFANRNMASLSQAKERY